MTRATRTSTPKNSDRIVKVKAAVKATDGITEGVADMGSDKTLALTIESRPGRLCKANGSATENRKAREIKKRVLLTAEKRNISAGDFAALLSGLVAAIRHPKVGFNHATADVAGWLASIAPYGITLNDAFIEDMLYACNMLDELGEFSHPEGKTFTKTLATVLRRDERFDKEINSIVRKGK